MVEKGILTHERIAWEDSARARRVISVDGSGNLYSLNNPLPVTSVDSTGTTTINIFGQSLIAKGATMTLATYTVPAGKKFTFTGGLLGGDGLGIFTFSVNGTTIGVWRNSGSVPSTVLKFIESLDISATGLAEIKVKNDNGKPRTFEVTLSGYNIDI